MAEPIPLDDDISALDAPLEADPDPLWMASDENELMPAPLTTASELVEAEMPPERVRFAAPVTVELPSVAQEHRGAVLNLSASGLACALPVVLHDGERVRCRFRLGLGEAPIATDAEVVWRRPHVGDDSLYGLRFVDLPASGRARVRDAVRERAEGRAGEWPLPVLPALPSGASRRLNAWVAGLAGMAIGALLSVGISFLPTAERDVGATTTPGSGQRATPVAASELASELQGTPAGNPVFANEPGPMPLDPGPTGAAPVSTQEVPPGVAAAAGAAESEPPTETGVTVVPPASPASEASAKTIGVTATDEGAGPPLLRDSARGLEIVLRTDGPVSSYRTFWLEAPRRLVIDIAGVKSAHRGLEFPLQHALVSLLRVGKYEDKVRFVIEASDRVARKIEARPDGSSLAITLRRE